MSLLAAPAGDRGGIACRRHRPLPAALLLLLVLAVYANSFPGTFILDDEPLVRDNPLVAALDLPRVFATDYWGGSTSGLYRPLAILSFALSRLLPGPSAAGHHAVNVLLHAANAALLCALLRRWGQRAAVALLAAAVFAVHPVNTESVNIVVNRAELLAALFVLLGLLAAAGSGRGRAAAAGAAYLAALLSKEHAVVFPALLVAADAFTAPRGGVRAALRRRLGLYALLAAIAAAWLLARSAVLEGGQPVKSIDNPLLHATPAVRVLTAARVQLLYLGKLALPLHLQAIYTRSSVAIVDPARSARAFAAPLALALTAALLLRGWRRRQAHALGITLYAISASVSASVLFVTAILVAERYLYLPSAWFALGAASLLFGPPGPAAAPRRRAAAAAIGAAWVLLLAGRAVVRNPDYRSGERLWRSALAADPGNVRAWIALAEGLWNEGRLDEAEAAFRSAVAADPAFPGSAALYGLFLLDRNRPAEAYQSALRGGGGPLANVVLAEASLRLGNPQAALVYLGEVRDVVPVVRGRYWLAKARAHEALGERDAAEAAQRRLREP